ncbi:MAG: hypothetical protein JO043_06370 [Candidatus Eremiobacteraeota bacterium]|nr:hypothetical protein [Candidatus Eremiobacteraeota bacterium]
MLRYVVIATAVVFIIGAVATAIHRWHAPLQIASVASTGSPSPPRRQAVSTFSPGPVTGEAPWAFDALIDCFRHERTFRGSRQFVSRHVPAAAERLERGSALYSGPCTAIIGADTVRVIRSGGGNAGVDVEIPAHVAVLFERLPQTGGEPEQLRVYVMRWNAGSDARLDRLRTMPFARVEPPPH